MTDDSTPDDAFAKHLQKYQDAMDSHDVDRVTAAVHDFFELAQSWCEQNPSEDLELTASATECEEIADWQGAESLYRQILALPDIEPATEWKARSDVAALYRLLGRFIDALEEDCRATAAARRADNEVLLVMALGTHACTLIDCHRAIDAAALIDEALAVVHADERYNQMRAGLLVSRANCAIHAGQFSDAERQLVEASDLLKPYADLEIAAGAHRTLARCWSASAALHTARNDYESAVDAWSEAVSISRHIASLPHVEGPHTRAHLSDMLLGLARALERAGRSDEAAEALNERELIRHNLGLA